MSEIAQGSGKGGKKGKPKKLSTRVDFTPMVDLGFLLITFFMLATTLSKPQTMEIAMPPKDVNEIDKTQVKASRAVTIVLDKNDVVYYYEGTRDEKTGVDPVLNKTDFSPSGIRKFLIKRNYEIMVKVNDLKAKKDAKQITQEEFDKQKTEIVAAKTAPIVIIKATDGATYGNLVNILDEMAICNIERYAIVNIDDFDKTLIKNKPNS